MCVTDVNKTHSHMTVFMTPPSGRRYHFCHFTAKNALKGLTVSHVTKLVDGRASLWQAAGDIQATAFLPHHNLSSFCCPLDARLAGRAGAHIALDAPGEAGRESHFPQEMITGNRFFFSFPERTAKPRGGGRQGGEVKVPQTLGSTLGF